MSDTVEKKGHQLPQQCLSATAWEKPTGTLKAPEH